MDVADLKVFAAVARTGSMSRAAVELNTVQSNVTQRIKTLEDQLGAALFQRTHRGAVLTAAGRRLLPYAPRVAHLLDDARRAVVDQETPAGPLVIGSLETTAALRLSPLLAEFSTTYTDVDLSLRTGTSSELVEHVLGRRVDGAFVCGPVAHSDLAVEPLFAEELVLLTAPGVADLDAFMAARDFKIVVLRTGCSYRLILEAFLARRGVVGTRVLEFGTLETIISCVSAGLGVTLLPEALIGPVWRKGRVAIHPLPKGEGRVETVFVRHRDAYATSALRAFVELARPAMAVLRAAE